MKDRVTVRGGTVSQMDFNLTVVAPWDSVNEDFAGEPTSITGTIIADGTSYNAADLDWSGGGSSTSVTDPHFVVAGQTSDGVSRIVYSEDGSAWGSSNVTEISSVVASFKGIACNSASKCVAVGDNGTVFYSSNGTSWTAGNSGTSTNLTGVAFGNDRWVAVGDGGIFDSTSDGATWTASSVTSGLQDVAYGDGSSDTKWVAVSQSADSYRSADGVNWTLLNLNSVLDLVNDGWMQSICFGNDTWVSVGLAGNIYYATDPSSDTNWTRVTYGGSSDLTGVSYGNGRFIAVGQGTNGWNGESPILIVSGTDDPSSWSEKTLQSEFTSVSRPLGDIAYGNGRWSALGNGGDHLLSTDDGATWSVIALDKYGAFAIAYRP